MSLRPSQLLPLKTFLLCYFFPHLFLFFLLVFFTPRLALCCPCAAARRPTVVCNLVEKSPTAIPFSGPCPLILAFDPALFLLCFYFLSPYHASKKGPSANPFSPSILLLFQLSHGSSIGYIVCWSVQHHYLPGPTRVMRRHDLANKKAMTKSMTKTNTFREHTQRTSFFLLLFPSLWEVYNSAQIQLVD